MRQRELSTLARNKGIEECQISYYIP